MKKIITLFFLIFLFSCSLINKEYKQSNDLKDYIIVNNWDITKKTTDLNSIISFVKNNNWIFISISNRNINTFIKYVENNNLLNNKDYFRLEIDKISSNNLYKILSLLSKKNIKEININILNFNNNLELKKELINQVDVNNNIKKIEIIFNWIWKISLNKKSNKFNILNLP